MAKSGSSFLRIGPPGGNPLRRSLWSIFEIFELNFRVFEWFFYGKTRFLKLLRPVSVWVKWSYFVCKRPEFRIPRLHIFLTNKNGYTALRNVSFETLISINQFPNQTKRLSFILLDLKCSNSNVYQYTQNYFKLRFLSKAWNYFFSIE